MTYSSKLWSMTWGSVLRPHSIRLSGLGLHDPSQISQHHRSDAPGAHGARAELRPDIGMWVNGEDIYLTESSGAAFDRAVAYWKNGE